MLFSEIIYGPIHSRRLGVSLGVNLMPRDSKLCSFDCIYCECGFNRRVIKPQLPTAEEFRQAMLCKLEELSVAGIVPQTITFSGNGEPTMHPDFAKIVSSCVELRDSYCPQAAVTVLSNSTQLYRTEVVEALRKVDNRVLKLDSAIDSTMRLIDQPLNPQLSVADIKGYLSQFDGDFTLQTCFLKGVVQGQVIDNTTDTELEAWYAAVEQLRPRQVMIYVIDRKTPVETLEKIPAEKMNRIGDVLRGKGFEVVVSA